MAALVALPGLATPTGAATSRLRSRKMAKTDLPITVGQAVAGAKVTAQDIDGNEVTFKVPAGSSSGTEVRISGRGVANRQGDGDLIGRVQIRIPDKPSLKVKHAAKEFDKECGDFADELAKER